VLRALALALAALAGACGGTPLPDPDSPGAVVYRARCTGCHRLHAPGAMTAEMWKVQVGRMRGEFARRGLPWLAPGEEQALLGYLSVHAGTS
jgi:hypothetical protein